MTMYTSSGSIATSLISRIMFEDCKFVIMFVTSVRKSAYGVGCCVGVDVVGRKVGAKVGAWVGTTCDGECVGWAGFDVGRDVGCDVGNKVGCDVGVGVGCGVPLNMNVNTMEPSVIVYSTKSSRVSVPSLASIICVISCSANWSNSSSL